MRPRILKPIATAALVLIGGCLNIGDTIEGCGEDPTPDLASPTATTPRNSSGPSVTGLDRRRWEPVVVQAPRGQVEHQPTYAEPLVLEGGPARDGQVFPSVGDATRLGASPQAAAAEGAAEFVWPAALLVVSPARMVLGMPPWLTLRGPGDAAGVMPAAQMREVPGLWIWVSAPVRPSP